MQFIIPLFIIFISFSVHANDTPIEVSADNALEWDRANMVFNAKGNALISQGDSAIKATDISAKYLELNDNITIQSITASPNAILTQPDEKLSAEKISADFEKGVLATVTATNNVILTTEKETLHGDKATYDAIKRVIVITGNVKIEQGGNILTGNRAEFDLNTNISKLSNSGTTNGGRVRAVFKGGQ